MKKVFLSIITVFATCLMLGAQGTDALSFTRIDRNPVTSGMAGAGSISLYNAAYSAFSNSSGLVFDDQGLFASVSYQRWAPGAAPSNNLAAGVASKVSKRFAVSFGFSRDMLAPYELYGYDGLVSGKYTPTQTQMALGMGIAMGPKLSLGINARYAFDRLAEGTIYSGFAGDVMFAYKASETLRFGAGVANIGSPITATDKKSYNQPASAKLSASWYTAFENSRIDVNADTDYYFFSGGVAAAIGAQYAYWDQLFARVGYRFATDKSPVPGYLSLGAGIKYKFVTLDVSYLTASKALGNTFAVGVGYCF